MPIEQHQFLALIQRLENDLYLAETLFFPGLSRVHDKGKRLLQSLKSSTMHLLKAMIPSNIYQRHACENPEIREIEVALEAPQRTPAWRDTLLLKLQSLIWPQGEEKWIAYLPMLGIEVIAEDEAELLKRIPHQVRAALMRSKQFDLAHLVRIQRVQALYLRKMGCTIDRSSPKQRAIQLQSEEDKDKSVLSEVATSLTIGSLPEAHEVTEQLHALTEPLTERQRQSVLLVGASGVGKTALVHELVRRRKSLGLDSTSFFSTSGSRIVAGMTGFGMWQERCQKMCKELKQKKAILHVGNLMELMEVGKSVHQSQGIASFLRPYIVRGELTIIAECTPEQKTIIERVEPQLFHAFVEVQIDEPDRERGQAILMSEAIALAISRSNTSSSLPMTNQALSTLDALHRRYATYSAYPGRPLRFLRNLLADHPADSTVDRQEVTKAFARETGLPLFLLEDSVPLDLKEAQEWFATRVIGQNDAVSLIVDLLATVKAQMTRPQKPIASLMFIGPTGVGKTEMAKALAEFLFGSRERLTRFDMSEYADPLASQRLIGGLGSAEGLLTAKVREQPFSVILLDEVEKAHPQFFDLLLQVLGEGRLTDASGRLADFCTSVVIMTSNLGAESYQKGAVGFRAASDSDLQQAKEHFETAVQKRVRPELFNRIDRVVPFGPLQEDILLQITHRMLEQIQSRDGIRYRGAELTIDKEVHAWLAKVGFDIRYGARPLKRAIERELLAPLAEQMNDYQGDTAVTATVQLKEG